MPNSPLLLDLAGVARLADVQRPVASVWRRRFASGDNRFPEAAVEIGGRVLFDAISVAQWLASTAHGNNPDAVADAAASASPIDFDISDATHVVVVDALLALRAASGEPVGGLPADELRRRAAAADPEDSILATEVSGASASWAEWADLLADAAYSPIEASRLLERRHAATRSSAGSAGPLTLSVEELLVELAGALAVDDLAELVVGEGITPGLVAELLERLGGDIDLVVPGLREGRHIRRRHLCEGLAPPTTDSVTNAPRLFIERLPSGAARSTSETLRAVDEVVLAMRDHDRAVVLAPARVLVDAISGSDGLARAELLRSGRIRAIAKLPAGLLTAAPREALSLWVLGRPKGDIPVADRVTAVADLSDVTLTKPQRTSLTNDVLAAMGSAGDMRGHAFRFTRLPRTTSLIASRRSLVAGGIASVSRSTQDLPALLHRALENLGADAPVLSPISAAGNVLPPMSVERLIAERHLRLLAGTRIATDEYYDSGFAVIGPEGLDDLEPNGAHYVDPIVFRARHPAARITVAGDVIFRTGPTAKAWVDPVGSRVVLYPARILRVNRTDPGGLVPELIAADITASTSGAGAWKRWRLRRVTPQTVEPLRQTLGDLAAQREILARRIRSLDAYADLLSAGLVSGAVAYANDAAAAAPDPQRKTS